MGPRAQPGAGADRNPKRRCVRSLTSGISGREAVAGCALMHVASCCEACRRLVASARQLDDFSPDAQRQAIAKFASENELEVRGATAVYSPASTATFTRAGASLTVTSSAVCPGVTSVRQRRSSWRTSVVKPGPPSEEYLPRKLLRCDRCGARMHGRYVCSTRRNGESCGEPIVKAQPLEEQLVDWIRDFRPMSRCSSSSTPWARAPRLARSSRLQSRGAGLAARAATRPLRDGRPHEGAARDAPPSRRSCSGARRPSTMESSGPVRCSRTSAGSEYSRRSRRSAAEAKQSP